MGCYMVVLTWLAYTFFDISWWRKNKTDSAVVSLTTIQATVGTLYVFFPLWCNRKIAYGCVFRKMQLHVWEPFLLDSD